MGAAAEIADHLCLGHIRNRPWHIQGTCAITAAGIDEGLKWLSAALGRKQGRAEPNELLEVPGSVADDKKVADASSTAAEANKKGSEEAGSAADTESTADTEMLDAPERGAEVLVR